MSNQVYLHVPGLNPTFTAFSVTKSRAQLDELLDRLNGDGYETIFLETSVIHIPYRAIAAVEVPDDYTG